jgi:hypothetical protein
MLNFNFFVFPYLSTTCKFITSFLIITFLEISYFRKCYTNWSPAIPPVNTPIIFPGIFPAIAKLGKNVNNNPLFSLKMAPVFSIAPFQKFPAI